MFIAQTHTLLRQFGLSCRQTLFGRLRLHALFGEQLRASLVDRTLLSKRLLNRRERATRLSKEKLARAHLFDWLPLHRRRRVRSFARSLDLRNLVDRLFLAHARTLVSLSQFVGHAL